MEKLREDRLVREHAQALQGRWAVLEASLKALSILPEARACGISIGDIALMPEIREIVDVPADVLVGEASFAGVHAKFGDMVERWRMDAATTLRRLIMETQPARVLKETKRKTKVKATAQPKVDVLELATTRFRCRRCNAQEAALYWPGVLAHACVRSKLSPLGAEDTYKRFIYGNLVSRTDGKILCTLGESLDVAKPSVTAKVIIRGCGKNPDTVTAKEMNALDIMLMSNDGKIRTWRSAVCLSL